MADITPQERFRGCLLAGAAGDALGAPVEFMSRADILRHFSAAGITAFAPGYERVGAITDDTQMTLFTAAGLLAAWCGDGDVVPPPAVIWPGCVPRMNDRMTRCWRRRSRPAGCGNSRNCTTARDAGFFYGHLRCVVAFPKCVSVVLCGAPRRALWWGISAESGFLPAGRARVFWRRAG